MASDEGKTFIGATFNEWQLCTLLSCFWPGSRTSRETLCQGGVQKETLTSALHLLLTGDADDTALWNLFSD